MEKNKSLVMGAVALVFLATGYQTALFISKATVAKITAQQPDTVFVYLDAPEEPETSVLYPPADKNPVVPSKKDSRGAQYSSAKNTAGKRADRGSFHSAAEKQKLKESVSDAFVKRRYECFDFDPNAVSIEELQRLGFSFKQAESIIKYREKGGRFRRPSDFAKSFVVADSVYQRLEPYIVIPKIDINKADSALFESLPGIGPYFAAKMVSYRSLLRGYSYPEQLMDIYHFDYEKYKGLADLITVGESRSYPLWTLPADSLRLHPYIKEAARAIVLYRENQPKAEWTVQALKDAGVLSGEFAEKLNKCRIILP